MRYFDHIFEENSVATFGVDFKTKLLEIETKRIQIQVWDTAGQERFRSMTSSYFRHCNGVILTYDISDRPSFENVNNWMNEVNSNSSPNICKMLIGNKCDLDFEKRTVQ